MDKRQQNTWPSKQIGAIAKLEEKEPGAEGILGKLPLADLLIQLKANNNPDAATLLLLESCVLGKPDAHDRVIGNILGRYLTEDRGLWYGSGPHKVPRFLLNDIARYWRTMAVDLAYKQRTRGGTGLALRHQLHVAEVDIHSRPPVMLRL